MVPCHYFFVFLYFFCFFIFHFLFFEYLEFYYQLQSIRKSSPSLKSLISQPTLFPLFLLKFPPTISVSSDKSFDIFNITHLSIKSLALFGSSFANTIKTFSFLKYSFGLLYLPSTAAQSLIDSSILYCSVPIYSPLGRLNRNISVFVEQMFPKM